MADPLSFFAINSDDSDSDASSGDEHDPIKASKNDSIADKKDMKSEKKRLPPPMDVLAGAKRPEFTIDSSHEDVDWDKLAKKAPVVPEKEFKPWENRLPTVDQSVKTKSGKTERTLAQQAPGASAPNKAEGPVQGRPQEYVDHAMQWSKMYQTMDLSGKVKRVRPEEIGGEQGFLYTDLDAQKVAYDVGSKKQKTDLTTFRTKEAKKRTLGQSNRDKMFVEEEKRVLRQHFDGNL